MGEKVITAHLKTFPQMTRWDRFNDTDKGQHITLSGSNGHKSNNKVASDNDAIGHNTIGTVRAGLWVDREGYATATVRVDRVCDWRFPVHIGVVAEEYVRTHSPWDDSPFGIDFGSIWSYSTATYNQPLLTAGSKFTVTLRGGTVTFALNGSVFRTFKLPTDCGRICLAVTLSHKSAV